VGDVRRTLDALKHQDELARETAGLDMRKPLGRRFELRASVSRKGQREGSGFTIHCTLLGHDWRGVVMIEAHFDASQVDTTALLGTTIVTYVWQDVETLNTALATLVLAQEVAEPGIRTTNAGGWHSRKDFPSWTATCVSGLIGRIRALGSVMLERARIDISITPSDLEVEAWANVNRRGHFNKHHHHLRNKNIWSGVYYVTTGVIEKNGDTTAPLLFVDAHEPLSDRVPAMEPIHQINPQPGLMVLFPSSLWHYVPAHGGSSARISIAFNLRHPRLSTLHYDALADPSVSRA